MKSKKYIKRILISILILLPTFANASIIFQDDFNNTPDWQSQESLEGTQPGNILWGTTFDLSMQAPQNWSDYRTARGSLSSLGKQTFEINDSIKRGSSGKSLIANYEIYNDFVGGHIGKWLGDTGHDELYVRFWKWYEPGYKIRTASGSAIHKWLRIMSNVDDPRNRNLSNPQSMYSTPVSRPDWKHNCDVLNGGTGGSASGTFDPATGTYECGKQAYVIPIDANQSGVYGQSRLQYNPEGHTGSVSDPSKVFDGNVRFYWKDYHGQQVIGNAGDFPWNAFDSTGIDYQGNGQWVMYEVHVKMNDIGQTNFLYEAFLDGNKVAQVSNLEFRKTLQTKFNYIMIPDNMLNGVYKEQPAGFLPPPEGEQTFAIDDIVVYTPLTDSDPLWNSSPQDGRLPLNYVIGGGVADSISPSAPVEISIL